MSLIRQLWLLVIISTAMTCTGSLVTTLLSNRQYLQDQLQIKNHDNAASLAISLSQQGGDMDSIKLLVSAQYDTGHYRQIRLLDPQGKPLTTLVDKKQISEAPEWFIHFLPIESTPGVAQVSSGWNQIGSIEVVSHSEFAHGTLWQGAIRLTLLLTLVGLVAGLCGTIIIRRTVTPLSGLVRQAQALSDRRFIKSESSSIPELMSLTKAMNSMVDRVQGQYAEHAATVERLRHAATTDPVTGLSNREELQAELREILAEPAQSENGRHTRSRSAENKQSRGAANNEFHCASPLACKQTPPTPAPLHDNSIVFPDMDRHGGSRVDHRCFCASGLQSLAVPLHQRRLACHVHHDGCRHHPLARIRNPD
jgi:hypothetical protein